jgi:uncharacterized protein (TIGR03066 family)
MRWSLLGMLLVLGLSSCAGGSPVAEADYPKKIVGDWQGSVGDKKETMSFKADGMFVAELRPLGFISNTLSQGVTGSVRGTWAMSGKVITMTIISAENERLQNRSTSSTIVSFKQDEIVVKSESGETSTFTRVI